MKTTPDSSPTSGAPNCGRKHRVLVADDHPLVREGIVLWLNEQRDLECCGQADTFTTVHESMRKEQPDLLLLDLRLRHEDGLELIKSLQAHFPAVRILILSGCDETLYAERAIRAGAAGYVMKTESTSELLVGIRAVLNGELYLSPRMALSIAQMSLQRRPKSRGHGVEILSDRELQVFQLMGSGLGTSKIAAQLNLSVKTIDTYRENLKQKLGFPSARELVRNATDWVESGGHRSTVRPEPAQLASKTHSSGAIPKVEHEPTNNL